MQLGTSERAHIFDNSHFQWVALLCVLYVFIAVRPYTGIRHDGILYLAQALYRLDPGIFATDLFFKYGSQESFSLFGRLYAFAIGRLGAEVGSIALLLVSQVLFFGASVAWTRRVLPHNLWIAGLLAIALSSGIYGGEHFALRYAEPFVTARPFAEGLSILALALSIGGRRWPALALLGVAAALHPLMTLPAVVVWWWLQARQDRRWLFGLGAIPLVVALASAGVRPLDGLFLTHDLSWREAMERENVDIFVGLWSVYDYLKLATDFILCGWALRYLKGVAAPAVRALMALTLGCMLVSYVGADLSSNVLITALQLWRAHWLLHFVAMSLVPLIAVRLFFASNALQLASVLLVYGAVCRGLPTGFAALVLAFLIMSASQRSRFTVDVRLVRAVALVLVAAVLVIWQNNVSWLLSINELSGARANWVDIAWQYWQRPPVGPMLVPLLLLTVCWRWGSDRVFAAAAASLVVVTLTVHEWDKRSPWVKEVESVQAGEHPFNAYVPPTEEVYWAGDALAPWLMLHRRSYVSGMQAAGQPFNQGTSQELRRRLSVTALFDFHAQVCGLMNKLNGVHESCEPDLMTVRSACEMDERLTWVVTAYNMGDTAVARWQPKSMTNMPNSAFYLYSCRKLLASSAK